MLLWLRLVYRLLRGKVELTTDISNATCVVSMSFTAVSNRDLAQLAASWHALPKYLPPEVATHLSAQASNVHVLPEHCDSLKVLQYVRAQYQSVGAMPIILLAVAPHTIRVSAMARALGFTPVVPAEVKLVRTGKSRLQMWRWLARELAAITFFVIKGMLA